MSLRSNNQKERERYSGKAGKTLQGEKLYGWQLGETTSQAKHEIKMRLRCILDCHDADDDAADAARSCPGKGVAFPGPASCL